MSAHTALAFSAVVAPAVVIRAYPAVTVLPNLPARLRQTETKSDDWPDGSKGKPVYGGIEVRSATGVAQKTRDRTIGRLVYDHVALVVLAFWYAGLSGRYRESICASPLDFVR